MRKPVIFIAILSGLIAGCAKNETPVNTESAETYRGVVIKNTCCQVAIQTLGTKDIGESWMDGTNPSTPVYTNAFKVANYCEFGNHIAGDTINFKLVSIKTQSCTCCALYTSTPSKAHPIRVVK